MFLVTTSCAVGCLITSPSSFQALPPVTAPVIVDEPGVTSPRIGNIIIVDQGDSPTLVQSFRVPVEDNGLFDPLQFHFFVNADRDCLARNGGNNCQPQAFGEKMGDGTRRRLLVQEVPITELGCNRVELWVSSRFSLSGNYRTPERDGDVASATWWIFVRPRPGTITDPDAGTANPVEQCRFLVQP